MKQEEVMKQEVKQVSSSQLLTSPSQLLTSPPLSTPTIPPSDSTLPSTWSPKDPRFQGVTVRKFIGQQEIPFSLFDPCTIILSFSF